MVSLFVFGILTSIKNKLKHLVTLVWSVRHKKYFPTSSASKCLKKKHGRFVKHDCLIKKVELTVFPEAPQGGITISQCESYHLGAILTLMCFLL